MRTSFQLVGIDHQPFQALFELPGHELARHHATRCVATEAPGYPCRVSLEDAQVGEELLLLPYLHQPASSPYRASGPIFVRRGALRQRLPVDHVPRYVTDRLISVRAYDAAHMMVGAAVCDGTDVAREVRAHFAQPEVAYIHLHNAKRGCFSCEVVRA